MQELPRRGQLHNFHLAFFFDHVFERHFLIVGHQLNRILTCLDKLHETRPAAIFFFCQIQPSEEGPALIGRPTRLQCPQRKCVEHLVSHWLSCAKVFSMMPGDSR